MTSPPPKTEEKLALLASIVESSNDAIIGASLDQRVLSWNRGAERIYGYTEEEMLGSSLSILVPHELKEETAAIMARVGHGEWIEHFETTRVRKDGRIIDVALTISPIKAPGEQIVGTSLITREITQRKHQEQENQTHLRFVENLDRFNQATQGSKDLEQMMNDMLDEVLSLFNCDRAWLLHPFERGVRKWKAPIERTRPEYPGALAKRMEIEAAPELIDLFESSNDPSLTIQFVPGSEFRIPPEIAKQHQIKSQLVTALYPKIGKPYLFGLHQCSYERVWTPAEVRLFQEVARRLSDNMTSLLMQRTLCDNMEKLKEAQRMAHIGYWDRDLVGNRISLAAESCRIFGISTEESILALDEWHERWLKLIHPEDSERVAQAMSNAVHGNAPYNLEYRIIQPGGQIRHIHSEANVAKDESGKPIRMLAVMQDITERKRAEEEIRKLNTELEQRVELRTKELAKSEKLFRSIYDMAPVSIWQEDWTEVTTAIGELRQQGVTDFPAYFQGHPEFVAKMLNAVKILDVNQWTPGMFGAKDKTEMMASLGKVFASPDTLPGFVGELIAHAQGEPVYRTEMTLNMLNGNLVHVLLAMSFPPAHAASEIVLVTVIDISQRKRAEENIRELNAKLQERAVLLEASNKELESFSYSVSHDLRAPLRSIDGFSKALMEDCQGKLDEDSMEHLKIIRSASQRMAQLIEDVLQLSRITRTPLRRGPVDLSVLAEAVVEDLKRSGPERQVEIIIQPGCRASADENQMRIVLENLIGNAWKFTGKTEGARIEFGKTTFDGIPVFFVRDNGAGFDMQYASHLFGAFQRMHKMNEFPGTGIGLASVQRIMHRHDGEVWMEAKVDQGATAYFTFTHLGNAQ